MKIHYRTKEESNRKQEEAFLALPPHERFLEFLKLSRRIMKFRVYRPLDEKKDVFIIDFSNERNLER